MKCIRQQYVLRHYVTGNIYGEMGNTYNRMEILVSDIEKLFSLWDRKQLIVILSCTRVMTNTFFVGPKNKMINGLKHMLTKQIQWCDYIDEVMKIINFKPTENYESLSSLNKSKFPCLI